MGDNKELFVRALRAAQIVKYSAERLDTSATPQLDAGFVEIQTLGRNGLRFRMRSLDPTWVTVPSIRLTAVKDTAGAGDWCTAGFLHLMSRQLQGGMISELGYNYVYAALRAGQLVAALNCLHMGARGLMRHAESGQIRNVLYQIERTVAHTVPSKSAFNLSDAASRYFLSNEISNSQSPMPTFECCDGDLSGLTSTELH